MDTWDSDHIPIKLLDNKTNILSYVDPHIQHGMFTQIEWWEIPSKAPITPFQGWEGTKKEGRLILLVYVKLYVVIFPKIWQLNIIQKLINDYIYCQEGSIIGSRGENLLTRWPMTSDAQNKDVMHNCRLWISLLVGEGCKTQNEKLKNMKRILKRM